MKNASSMLHEDAAPLFAFDYLYRDAGNFKSYGTILLRGDLSRGEQDRITNAMETQEFFIAEQISIPPLYDNLFKWSGGRIPSDHAWHSFSQFRKTYAEEPEDHIIWGSTADLLTAFERVKQWDISMSPNFNC